MRPAKLPRPGDDLGVCVHPKCHRAEQVRYEFPIPLCGAHLVKTLTAAGEVIRAAKVNYSRTNEGKQLPFPVKTRIAHDDVVYYIRFGDRIKIGTSSDLRSRLRALPFDELLATEPGGVDLERRRHEQFADDLVAGREWFTPSEALLSHIESLNATNP